MPQNYTYEDFQSYLPQAGLTEDEFSPEDLALAKSNPAAGVELIGAKSDYKNATTDDQRFMANAKANQIRSQGGYSGGIDGVNGNASLTPDDLPGYQSSAIPTANTQPYDLSGQTPSSFQSAPAPAPFSFDKQAPVYQSTGTYNNQYAGQQKQSYNDVMNYKPFEFNAETNPQMQAYTKQYRREGDRAMQDTIGSLSAATGGIPSTAVASAAGQANDYYMSQLGDKLPQIYESEFNKYLSEFGMAKDKLNTVNNQENIDYTKYWDGERFNFDMFLSDRNQYNSERGQALNEYGQNRNDYNADRTFDYGKSYDDLTFKTDANNTAYNRQTDADNTAYNRGRDTINDEQYATEQKRLADSDAFDRKYKIDTMNQTTETNNYNKAIDRFEMMGYADAQTEKILGVKEDTLWGGEAAEIALQQSKLNLEQTQANINNTNANTANVGKTGGSVPRRGDATDEEINAAYARVEAGTGTAADRALLNREGVDPPAPKGNESLDSAWGKIAFYDPANPLTKEEYQALIDDGQTDSTLKSDYGWDGKFADGAGESSDTDWQSAYDPASLKQYNIQSEDDLDNLDDSKYTLQKDPKTGLIKIVRITH